MDYVRVFVSKRGVVGTTLGEITYPGGFDYQFIQVTRGDSDLLPRSDLIVEFGDHIGLFVNRANMRQCVNFLGTP